MKKKLSYYFIFSVVIGSIVYICEKFEILLPKFIRFYVNDFLIIPIVLYSSLFVIRILKNDKNLQLTLLQILYVCTLYVVIFEYWLPKFHPRYTSDFIDVCLYFFSGILFYFLQKKGEN